MERIYRQYIDLPSWNLSRLLRVVFGVGMLGIGLANGDGLTSILATVVLLQGILNVGCMGQACALSPESRTRAKDNET